MPVKFNKVRAGDVLWQRVKVSTHFYRSHSVRWLEVQVLSVDTWTRTASVRLNGGPPQLFTRKQIEELWRNKSPPRQSGEPRPPPTEVQVGQVRRGERSEDTATVTGVLTRAGWFTVKHAMGAVSNMSRSRILKDWPVVVTEAHADWYVATATEHAALEEKVGRKWTATTGCACGACRAARRAKWQPPAPGAQESVQRPARKHVEAPDNASVPAMPRRLVAWLAEVEAQASHAEPLGVVRGLLEGLAGPSRRAAQDGAAIALEALRRMAPVADALPVLLESHHRLRVSHGDALHALAASWRDCAGCTALLRGEASQAPVTLSWPGMSDAARLELVRQRTGGPARLTEVLDRLPADMVLAHTGDGVLKPAGWWRAQVPAFKDATTYSLLVRGPGGLRRITVHGPEGALFEERVQGEDF